MRTTSLRPLLLPLALLASCGAPDPGTGDAIGESTAELSTRAFSYVRLRPDFRKCIAPVCGGYYVRDVNRKTAETYVSGLDFSRSQLDQDTIDKVLAAPTAELVLRGKLGSPERRFKTRPFLVTEAYRGMPGVSPVAGEAFYKAAPRNPPIQCFAFPCNNEVAFKLNTSSRTDFTSYSVAGAAGPFVDEVWLAARVSAHGAVVAARFSDGQQGPAGIEKVLDASQVFVRLPDRIGPCPLSPVQACPHGQVLTYTRSADRCLIAGDCVTPGICPQFFPACDADYTLSSWATAPAACPGFACDPTFVVN